MKRQITPLVALLALLAFTRAEAAPPFCVSDGSGLANALALAAQSSEADEIRLRVAQFATNADPMFSYSAVSAVTISGGWTDALCTNQVLTPESSVLNGGLARQVMSLNRSGAAGDVVLRNLTFQYGVRGSGGACLQINTTASTLATGRVYVQRNRFYTCRSDNGEGAGVLGHAAGAQIHLSNNIFVYNYAGAAAAFSISQDDGVSTANSNTVVGNRASFTGANQPTAAAWRAIDSGAFYVANNVFYDNKDWTDQAAGPELVLELGGTGSTAIADLNHNHFGLAAPPPRTRLTQQQGTLGDPGFASVPAFMPRPDSPLRDSGRNSTTGGYTPRDYAGDSRIKAGTIDRGAYEFQVLLLDGFE